MHFTEIFGIRKLQSLGGSVYVILSLAVLIQYQHVTDTHDDDTYHASIALHSKKANWRKWCQPLMLLVYQQEVMAYRITSFLITGGVPFKVMYLLHTI